MTNHPTLHSSDWVDSLYFRDSLMYPPGFDEIIVGLVRKLPVI